MSLESGSYRIYTADGGFPIGRRRHEDNSNRHKGIYACQTYEEAMVNNLFSMPCRVSPLTSSLTPLLLLLRSWQVVGCQETRQWELQVLGHGGGRRWLRRISLRIL